MQTLKPQDQKTRLEFALPIIGVNRELMMRGLGKIISRSHGVYFDQWESTSNPKLKTQESSNWSRKRGYGIEVLTPGVHCRLRAQVSSLDNNPNETEDGYLFIDQSNNDGEEETEFDDVPENITKDECNNLFVLSNNEISYVIS
ncbi:hypothetical protein TNCV_2277751 [Trichonephila clavipes]|nr:hypothetical protein TNCV_2277751 [Trichonephila clavipes]